MSTSRLETFSDGVFAIAATLLILNVDNQIPSHVHDLGARLLHIWPSYVAVSFVTIGIMWMNHHTSMGQIGRTDRRFMVATAVMFSVSWFYAAHRGRLLRPDADWKVVSGITRSYLPGPWVYLAATLIAFASPTASIVLFGAITLFYLVEGSVFGRSQGEL